MPVIAKKTLAERGETRKNETEIYKENNFG